MKNPTLTIPTALISTRHHGMVDYAVAALFGGLSMSLGSRALPVEVRRLLAGAAVIHAGYAALTDYEAGFYPLITMRQHLALDALGGAALCGAGVAMRQQSFRTRALLIAAGLSELAVVASSRAGPASGPGQGSGPVARLMQRDAASPTAAGYPPLDTLKPVAENLFIVDSLLPGAMGAVLPVRMTVIQLSDGGLLLHSPTQFSLGLMAELNRLGPVRHLVAPNVAHWTFLKGWQQAFPEATTWAAPGLRDRSQVYRSGVRLDHDLGEEVPPGWGDGFELVCIPGGLGFREIAMFHIPTRTLVLTDMVLNLEAAKLPLLLRPLIRLAGMTAPDGMPPPYLRVVVRLRRREAALAAARLLGLQPERVIFAHGSWFKQDGTAALRRSLRWLLN